MGLVDWVRGWFGGATVPVAPESAPESAPVSSAPKPPKPPKPPKVPKPPEARKTGGRDAEPRKPKKPNKGKNRQAETVPETTRAPTVPPPPVVLAAPPPPVEEPPPPLPKPIRPPPPRPRQESVPRPPPRKHKDQDTLAWVVVPKLEALLAEIDAVVAAEPPERKALLDARSRLEREWQALLPIPPDHAERLTAALRERLAALAQRIAPLPDPVAEEEARNLDARRALVAEAEALVTEPNLTAAIDRAKVLQRSWKDAPRLPRALLTDEVARFQAAMDAVFARRDSERSERIQKLVGVVDQAETLTRSKDPERAAEVMKQLQARWKAIGGVRGEEGDLLWTRLRAAADLVFERRRTAQVEAEGANLAARVALIDEALARAAEGVEDPDEAIRQLQARWKRIGHVPRDQADLSWSAFKSACDQLRAPPQVDPEALGDGDGALRFSPFTALSDGDRDR